MRRGDNILAATGYMRANASGALNTIVTPAANTKGIRLSAAILQGVVGIRIMAKSTAPTAWNDAAARTIGHHGSLSAVGVESSQIPILPLVIPAGLGLYEQAEGAGATSTVTLTYGVLT